MSQETCLDNIFVHGRGVPVVRCVVVAYATSHLHASAMAFVLNQEVKAMTASLLPVATLGTPRIGPRRELKFALESFWAGTSDEKSLLETAAARARTGRDEITRRQRDPVERFLAL